MNKLSKKQIEKLAFEIRDFLIQHSLWIDVTIYYNGKALSTHDGNGHFNYNQKDPVIILEDEDPLDYFEYVANPHILSMSFEGDFYGCLNYHNEYGADFDNMIQNEFSAILKKYGLYYELGNAWNLSCYNI